MRHGPGRAVLAASDSGWTSSSSGCGGGARGTARGPFVERLERHGGHGTLGRMDIDTHGSPTTIDGSTASELWGRTHHTCIETKMTVDGSVPPPCLACLADSSVKFAVNPIELTFQSLPSSAFGYVRPSATVVPAQVVYVGPCPVVPDACPGCGRCRTAGARPRARRRTSRSTACPTRSSRRTPSIRGSRTHGTPGRSTRSGCRSPAPRLRASRRRLDELARRLDVLRSHLRADRGARRSSYAWWMRSTSGMGLTPQRRHTSCSSRSSLAQWHASRRSGSTSVVQRGESSTQPGHVPGWCHSGGW